MHTQNNSIHTCDALAGHISLLCPPDSAQGVDQVLLGLESYILGLVEAGFMVDASKAEKQLDSYDSPFKDYYGVFENHALTLQVYQARSDNYRSYNFRLYTHQLDLNAIGDYWKYDYDSFKNLKKEVLRSIEFDVHKFSTTSISATVFVYQDDYLENMIYTRSKQGGFAFVQDVYTELMIQLISIPEFGGFFNQVPSLKTFGKVKNWISQRIKNSDRQQESTIQRTHRMTKQAVEIARLFTQVDGVEDILLFGSLGKSEYSVNVGDIDLMVFGSSFSAEIEEKGCYDSTDSTLEDALPQLLLNQNPELGYTNGDFKTYNSIFFSDMLYRQMVVNNQRDPEFFVNVFSDCMRWDTVSGEFVQVDFAYFKAKYNLCHSELVQTSNPKDRRSDSFTWF
ncbi:MAG: hypothetical protein ACRCXZ_00490 [Patescibacteria group bacterium]